MLGAIEIEVVSDQVKFEDVLMQEKLCGICEMDDASSFSLDAVEQLDDAKIRDAPSLSVLVSAQLHDSK